MKLWIQWLQAVRCLRPACTRSLTFLWMTLVLIGLCCRSDNLGITSFVRVLNLRGDAYHRFLHLFHSKGLDLDILTSCWVRLCLVLFRPFPGRIFQKMNSMVQGFKQQVFLTIIAQAHLRWFALNIGCQRIFAGSVDPGDGNQLRLKAH